MTFHIPKKALLLGSAKLKPQDTFRTSIFTGNGATQTITTGLDMAGKGGLIWMKSRSVAVSHLLFDTSRGINLRLSSNTTNAESNDGSVSAVSSSGFTVGNPNGNNSGESYVAWSFLDRPGFKSTVTYTGNGVAGRQIPHSLGVVPGMIVVKSRNGAANWDAYHRSLGATKFLNPNLTNAAGTDTTRWNDTDPTSSTFTLGIGSNVNAAGVTYVAYLWAQNPDLIDCGSYVGNGSTTGPVVTCGSGWKPQWLLNKGATIADDWQIRDASRNASNPRTSILRPNSSGAEGTFSDYAVDFTSTGFQPKVGQGNGFNDAGQTYIYCAIREAY